MPPAVEILPLNCSFDAFISRWERSHAVLLKAPRRATRAATCGRPRFAGAVHEALRGCASELAPGGFTLESTAAPATKKPRRAAATTVPATAAALLSGNALPAGCWYASIVLSRQPRLVAALLDAAAPHSVAPASLASPRVHHEEAVWLFIGRNASATEALAGRPPHTDEVEHDGTYHRQMEGAKEWLLRPTEELAARVGRRRRARSDGANGDDEPEAGCTVVRCEAGDVLVLSTREWWHSTRLPPADGSAGGDVSVSLAREFNLLPRKGKAAAAGAAADDEGGGPASFVNVEGLFAACAIPAGTVVATEEDDVDLELPSVPAARANCEVVEDDESGVMCLVATRDVRSGEFLCVAEEEEEEEEE